MSNKLFGFINNCINAAPANKFKLLTFSLLSLPKFRSENKIAARTHAEENPVTKVNIQIKQKMKINFDIFI